MSKQDKAPAFLICDNPMADEMHGERVFITHTRHPVIIAQVIDCSGLSEEETMDIKSLATVGATLDLGDEYYVFNAIYVDGKFGEGMDAQAAADKLAGVMRRMADWFEAYCKWEDKQVNN